MHQGTAIGIGIRRNLVLSALEHMAQHGTAPLGAVEAIDVGTGRYLEYFEDEVLRRLVEGGGATCRIYEGPYGAGKSHLLGLIRDMSVRRGMIVVSTDLSQCDSLGDWGITTRFLLESMEADIDGVRVRSLPGLLFAVSRGLPSGRLSELRWAALPSEGFKRAICAALGTPGILEPGGADQRLLLSTYLTGGKVAVSAAKMAGLAGLKGSVTPHNAESVLQTALGALRILGFRGSVLLFDENEKTLSGGRGASGLRDLRVANLMRRLVDSCFNGGLRGVLVAFSVLPGFVDTCARRYPALGQRLERPGASDTSYRNPVQSVGTLTDLVTQEDFLGSIASRLCELIGGWGPTDTSMRDRLIEAGQEVLESNAGSGYRRDLMKRLSRICLEEMRAG